MTRVVRFALLTDGSSDRCLLVLLRWLIGELAGDVNIESHWADLRTVEPRPIGLGARMKAATDCYPCDLLFVHRDAEAQTWESRVQEIRAAGGGRDQTWIPVVPVRMTEAWLLLDEAAIRRAADNPRGTTTLRLPTALTVEKDPDPKATLRNALVSASEKRGRRLRAFQETIAQRVQRVAELTTNYSALAAIPAFQRLRDDTKHALATLQSNSDS